MIWQSRDGNNIKIHTQASICLSHSLRRLITYTSCEMQGNTAGADIASSDRQRKKAK
jgi:hypothetical protein